MVFNSWGTVGWTVYGLLLREFHAGRGPDSPGWWLSFFGPVDRLMTTRMQQRFEVLLRGYRESGRDILGAVRIRTRSAAAPGCNTGNVPQERFVMPVETGLL